MSEKLSVPSKLVETRREYATTYTLDVGAQLLDANTPNDGVHVYEKVTIRVHDYGDGWVLRDIVTESRDHRADSTWSGLFRGTISGPEYLPLDITDLIQSTLEEADHG